MNTAAIGELYVLCELWRKNFDAYMANNATEAGWGILVLKDTNGILNKVRAKLKLLIVR